MEELDQAAATLGWNNALTLQATTHTALDILANRFDSEGLKRFAEAACHLTGAKFAAIAIASRREDGDCPHFVTAGLPDEDVSKIAQTPSFGGLLGVLLRSHQPVRLANLQQHPAFLQFPPNHPIMKSFLGIPIMQGSVVLGCLYLTDKISEPEFTTQDEAIVKALAVHMALAIHLLNVLDRQRALAKGLMAAHEEERRAIAYDLHDGLTQYVMTAHAHLQAYQDRHHCASAQEAKELQKSADLLEEAVIESRRLVNGLRALTLEVVGLCGAIEQLLLENKSRFHWQTAELTHNLGDRRFDESVETALFRVAQEALTNSGKHASTPGVQVTVLLEYGSDPNNAMIAMTVRDWGRGFDPQAVARESSHIGLHSMCERVRLMGGDYNLKTSPGKGVIIAAVVPIDLQ
jgi:signal transduction histidine kinase